MSSSPSLAPPRARWFRIWRQIWLFGPPLAYCGLLFWLSAQETLPAPPGNDKVAHTGAYAVLGGLLVRAFYFARRWSGLRTWITAALLAALYGMTDEWHQSFVPGRDASGLDWLADVVGAVSGSLMVLGGLRRFRSRS